MPCRNKHNQLDTHFTFTFPIIQVKKSRYVSGITCPSSGGLEQPGVDRRIILRWVFSKWNVGVWIGLGWFRIGTVGGHL
jgi:hypothetical protein